MKNKWTSTTTVFELTLRGMTSLVTRKRSRWKSDTMSRNDAELHWDRYVAKL